MKPVRPKIHLLDVDEPLLAYHNLIVRCGTALINAEPEFMVSETAAASPNLCIPTHFWPCLKCRAKQPIGREVRRYCYGLVEGQAALDAGRERENLEIMV